jgi:hypothetical protein
MYSKQEASQLRQQFWTAFGQYMQPVPSADGEKINWINYKTGMKDIHFRMQANSQLATIAVEIIGSLQELYFEQFQQFQPLLQNALGERWDWQLQAPDENGQLVSRISTTMHGISIFNRQDWPNLISFFKPRIVALDEFWSTARYSFEAL